MVYDSKKDQFFFVTIILFLKLIIQKEHAQTIHVPLVKEIFTEFGSAGP